MRTLSVAFVLTVFALGGQAAAKDIYLAKQTVDEMKAVCEKVGGHFSQDSAGYGCGTDCQGKAGTDCIVYCKADQKRCVAQVVGGRRPHTVESALQKPARH